MRHQRLSWPANKQITGTNLHKPTSRRSGRFSHTYYTDYIIVHDVIVMTKHGYDYIISHPLPVLIQVHVTGLYLY